MQGKLNCVEKMIKIYKLTDQKCTGVKVFFLRLIEKDPCF